MNKQEVRTEQQSKHDVMDRNPNVNVSVVDAYQKLERKLSELGIKVERHYGIEHPLESNRNKFSGLGLSRSFSFNRRA